MKKSLSILLTLLTAITFSFAHGDIHQRIISLSKEIKAHPDSAMLYLVRGELYHEHQLYKNAIKDFNRSKRKGIESDRLYLAFAKTYYKRKKTKKALRYLDTILEREPRQVRALRLRGNILLEKEEYCEAAESLNLVIEILEERLVENYLEAAAASEGCGDFSNNEEANLILKKGISDLGPLLIFYEKLREMALAQKDKSAAILHQSEIIKYSIRKELPYFERALLYIDNAELELANQDLQQSQSLLDQLPIRFQKMDAMQQLRIQIKEAKRLLPKK